MSAISNSTYSKSQMVSDFSNSTIKVDDALLQKVGDNMSKAGISTNEINTIKKELQEVAGQDKIIKGQEFEKLFSKLDGHDKNGSSTSFLLNKTANGVTTQTACGSVVDTLLGARTTTESYSLSTFNKEFQSGAVKVDTGLLSKINSTLAGQPYNMAPADRNKICNNLKEIAGQDGSISGKELQQLFKEIDRHDTNGDANSFIVSTTVDGNSTATVSGQILATAKDNFEATSGMTTADLLRQYTGATLNIGDISAGDMLSLTALGLGPVELKLCCDGVLSLQISGDSQKKLIDKLDKLDGNQDSFVTTGHSYLNGKGDQLTKAGRALNILSKYIVKSATVEEPTTTTTPTVSGANNPGSKEGSTLAAITVEDLSATIKAGGADAKQLVADIKANRKTIDQSRIDLKKNVKYNGKITDGNCYNGKEEGTPTAISNGKVSSQQLAVFREIAREGGWTAINTYDNQIFTFGQGFGGLGALPQCLKIWFKDEAVAAEFKKYGISMNGTTLQIVDTANNKMVTGKDAYTYIKKNVELQYLFANIAEDPAFMQGWIDAQYEYLTTEGAAKLPSYAKDWTDEACMAAAHIAHWLPAISWKSNNFSDCEDGVDVVKKAFTLMGNACKAGKSWTKKGFSSVTALNDDTYVLSYAIGLQHIKGWGDGKVFKELSKVTGDAIAISDKDISAGKYEGKILINNGSGKYYVLDQK